MFTRSLINEENNCSWIISLKCFPPSQIHNRSNASMYSQIIAARKYDNVGPDYTLLYDPNRTDS